MKRRSIPKYGCQKADGPSSAAASTHWDGFHILHQLLKRFAPALRKTHLLVRDSVFFGGMEQ